MIVFRLRDFASAIFWRLWAPGFGKFGRRTRIVRPLRIVGAEYCRLGDGVTIQVGAYIAVLKLHPEPPVLEIGRSTMIGHFAHIVVTRRVVIGNAVLTADRLYISDNRHTYENPTIPVMDQPLTQLDDVTIGDGTWIGENVSIIGCSIGRNCVIGANSMVTRDVPDYCVAGGTPARILKRWCAPRGAWLRTDPQGEFVE